MDGVLNNALQRISQLERIAVNNTSAQLDTEHASSSRTIDSDGPPNRYHTQTVQSVQAQGCASTANRNLSAAEEIYRRFPSLRMPSSDNISIETPVPTVMTRPSRRPALSARNGLVANAKKKKRNAGLRSTAKTSFKRFSSYSKPGRDDRSNSFY